MIAARAFADRIERGEDVHFLSGHDFNKPLASRSAGTLSLTDSNDALTVEATKGGERRSAAPCTHARTSGLGSASFSEAVPHLLSGWFWPRLYMRCAGP
ncbi:HK97 family phage prohead protease [Jannaschia seohaensis]|nr:HK97 family phage prohead protease [Jannaschia seohaensis]